MGSRGWRRIPLETRAPNPEGGGEMSEGRPSIPEETPTLPASYRYDGFIPSISPGGRGRGARMDRDCQPPPSRTTQPHGSIGTNPGSKRGSNRVGTRMRFPFNDPLRRHPLLPQRVDRVGPDRSGHKRIVVLDTVGTWCVFACEDNERKRNTRDHRSEAWRSRNDGPGRANA